MKFIKTFGMAALCGLAGCTGLTGPVIMAGDAAGIYATKPAELPPADTQDQIPAHESWCYRTEGDVECYAKPQNVPPERLVNVEPQSRYPLDVASYQDALKPKADKAPASLAEIEPLLPAPSLVTVQKNALAKVLEPTKEPTAPTMPKHKKHKKRKMKKSTCAPDAKLSVPDPVKPVAP